MNYPTGYEKVNNNNVIQKNWLYHDETWKLTTCVGCIVSNDMIKDYCRPIKHHSPDHSDLSPLPLHRFLTIGETIKDGDYKYYADSGWTKLDFAGFKLSDMHIPICRPIEQPSVNKEESMLVLELETLKCKDVNSSLAFNPNIVFFRIKKQSGFVAEKDYKSSVGLRIKSSDEPQYAECLDCFFIRGKNYGKDNDIVAVTNEQYKKIQAAVSEILERENKPKFIETLTFKSSQTGKRHKVNVISNDGQDLRGVDCDTNQKSIFSINLLTDIKSLPNAF